MSTSAFRLIVRRGNSPKTEYALSEQTVVMGREPINDVMLQELEISRRHASITYADGRYSIEDLNSTNGTFVNGRQISSPVVLREGDLIDLGDTVSLVFQGSVKATEATLVDSEPEIADQPTVQRKGEATLSQYTPPDEVPQFSGEEAPIPPPPWQSGTEPAQPRELSQMRPIPPPAKADRRRLYIGCGCLVLFIVAGCFASFALLDSYQGGDLLYCQTFRPIWETVFGPARVALICQ